RSDLFSLGIVLWELVTGRRLFAGSSSSEIFSRVTSFATPTDEDLAGVPDEVRVILRTCLQPDPDERYQHATQLEGALAHSLGPEGIVQARHALSSIVQRLFDEERKMETEVASVSGAVPSSDPDDAATHISASGVAVDESGAAVAASVAPIPREAPQPLATTPSGLTLAKSSMAAAPVQMIPPAMPARADEASRGMMYAGIAFVALLVVAAAFLVGKTFSGGSTPEATPTAVVVITPPALATNAAPTETAAATPTAATSPVVLATAEATATAAPTSAPTKPPRVAHTPAPNPTRVASAGPGFLNVNARPWVQVYVDGRLVATETPLRRFSIPSGRHVLKFTNPAAHFSTETSVDIPANGERAFFVDVKSGAVRPE
ncbi:MAG TPA: protein kinase, partial [bacterium]|nr:protein kinase [bacterium]